MENKRATWRHSSEDFVNFELLVDLFSITLAVVEAEAIEVLAL